MQKDKTIKKDILKQAWVIIGWRWIIKIKIAWRESNAKEVISEQWRL